MTELKNRTRLDCWARHVGYHFWKRCDGIIVEMTPKSMWGIIHYGKCETPTGSIRTLYDLVFLHALEAMTYAGLKASLCECTPADVLAREIEEALDSCPPTHGT